MLRDCLENAARSTHQWPLFETGRALALFSSSVSGGAKTHVISDSLTKRPRFLPRNTVDTAGERPTHTNSNSKTRSESPHKRRRTL